MTTRPSHCLTLRSKCSSSMLVFFLHNVPQCKSLNVVLQWVYNILEHKAEADRILYEDTDDKNGFLIAPDMKWTGEDMDSLYVSAIVKQRGIKSIRLA